jgi:DNA primase
VPIPDPLVEEIRLRADLVEVVSEHTKLKRSGRTWRGPCPLHGGEGPNFSVDPVKGFYKCFVCGEAGTVYNFLMKQQGMSFPEAVRAVAARVGVEIPEERRREEREEDPNAVLYEINQFAAKWFREQLAGEGGERARAYLDGRGIGAEARERFGIGWAPESFDAFGTAARRAGYRSADLLAVGLLKESKKAGREPYDAFRGRVVSPIEDAGGRVLGFGGRVLEAVEGTPKYLNSPETAIYHKGRTLYGLGWSRGAIRREEVALVVEGYMDYVSLAAHGIPNVVAPLGTAMTEEQAALVAGCAPRAILLYDSDRAGLRATFRSADQLLRAGVEVSVATLPEGEDPDSLVRGRGADALRRYLDDAIDVLERKLQLLERKGLFTSIRGTRRAIDALMPTVRAAKDELLRGVYLKRISDRTGVPVDSLLREAAEGAAAEAEGERRRAEAVARRAVPPPQRPARELRLRMGAERNLLMMMFHSERWVEECAKFVSPDDFEDPDYRRLFRGLIETEGRRDPEGRWLMEFPEDLLAEVDAIRADAVHSDWSAASSFFAESMDRILARPVEREFRRLKSDAAAGGEVDPAVLARLQESLLSKRENRHPRSRPGILDPDDPILRRERPGR